MPSYVVPNFAGWLVSAAQNHTTAAGVGLRVSSSSDVPFHVPEIGSAAERRGCAPIDTADKITQHITTKALRVMTISSFITKRDYRINTRGP